MDSKHVLGIGFFLFLSGGFLTGAFHRLLSGDTMTYLRYGGGYLGSAAGFLIIEKELEKMWKKR